jgi:hypothetical protein
VSVPKFEKNLTHQRATPPDQESSHCLCPARERYTPGNRALSELNSSQVNTSGWNCEALSAKEVGNEAWRDEKKKKRCYQLGPTEFNGKYPWD